MPSTPNTKLCTRGAPDGCFAPGTLVRTPTGLFPIERLVVGDEVQVSVTDSGPGIPLHERTSAVEWGRRGPDSPGHGIGLHAAYQLVVGMGGRLVIDGSRRVGTRIVVTLPGARGDLG